jgi:WD40 repeat protein
VVTGNEIQILKDLKKIKFGIVYSVAVSPDGKSVLTATTEDPELTLLDLNSGNEIRTFDLEFSPKVVAFSPDGKLVLSVSYYEPPQLWDITSGKLVRTFKIQKNIWQHLLALKGSWISGVFSPDGQYVLAANTDGTIRLWETATGKEVGTFKGHNAAVTFAVFSPDGKFIVSGGKDNTIRLWDKESEKELDRVDLRAENDIAYTGAFAPDGHSFIAGTERGVILHFSLSYHD